MEVRPLSAEYYRQHANRLRVDAEDVYDLTTRNELRDLARKYEALAEGVERMFNHFSKVQVLPARPSSGDRRP